jgi:hypothetical protein
LKAFRVVDVTATRTSSSKSGRFTGHKWNVQDFLRRIDEEYGSASRSIKHGEWKFNYADDLVTELKAYAKHFKLGRTFVENHIPSAEIREKVMARCNANNAREDERYREQMERAKAERALRDEANREQMERWTRWESGVRKVHTTKVYLRATEEKLDGKRIVETSHGADVPYDSARLLYRFASTKRYDGVDWIPRVASSHKVGDFTLNKVNSEGITVGCHRIGWEEIGRLAEVEGWMKG